MKGGGLRVKSKAFFYCLFIGMFNEIFNFGVWLGAHLGLEASMNSTRQINRISKTLTYFIL